MALICKGADIAITSCHAQVLTVPEAPSLLATIRRDARFLKLPPYISVLCTVIGVAWLLLLPLNEYSRHTYISENALLPGQVHTYFGGSEQQVFNAYKQELHGVAGKEQAEYDHPRLSTVLTTNCYTSKHICKGGRNITVVGFESCLAEVRI